MKINYNLTGRERKELVRAISEITGEPAKYLGAPTFSYKVSGFTMDKNGTLSFDELDDSGVIEMLIERLCEAGFEAEVQTEKAVLVIQMPRISFSNTALKNLEKLVEAKGSLIKKALSVNSLPIEVDEERISFPWFPGEPNADEVKTYTHFVSALCEMARTQHKINSVEKTVESEKYAFRCFLLRLGFIGPEYKAERKILLRNLSGSSAFKGGTTNEANQ